MKGPTGFLIALAVGAGLVLAGMGTAAVWMGGYWENWPLLDQVSGPQRFRQYVADPRAASVHELRGGYSGFPFGAIRTTFRYADTSLPFVTGWRRMDPAEARDVARVAGCPSTTVFRRPGGVYLFINATTQEGCLIVPGN
ncbi:MAG: hypothetical protein ACKO0M_02525 [Cyanobium sp.]